MTTHPRLPTLVLILGAMIVGNLGVWPAPVEAQRQRALSQSRADSRIRGSRPTQQLASEAVRKAFAPVVENARLGTVLIYSRSNRLAVGTVVSADGHVVTKASELRAPLECHLADGRRYPAQVIGVEKDHDLALLKMDAENVATVTWSDKEPVVGGIVATTSHSEMPQHIGVISVAPREIKKSRGILGVSLEDVQGGEGVKVSRVWPGSPAEQAGMREDDVIRQVNGTDVNSNQKLIGLIGGYQPGDKVRVTYMRDDQRFDVTATLSSSLDPKLAKRIETQRGLGTDLSERAQGFPLAFQHDTKLSAQDCGGPLVNLDGEVIGINIARASRVASYGLPASVVRELIPKLMSGELAPGPSVTERRRELIRHIADLTMRIEKFTQDLAIQELALSEAISAEQSAREAAEQARQNQQAQEQLSRIVAERTGYQQTIDQLKKELDAAQLKMNDYELEKVRLENDS